MSLIDFLGYMGSITDTLRQLLLECLVWWRHWEHNRKACGIWKQQNRVETVGAQRFDFDLLDVYINTQAHVLTVTVSPEPIFITASFSLCKTSLNSFTSLRVHIDAAAMGGNSSKNTTTKRSLETKINTGEFHRACSARASRIRLVAPCRDQKYFLKITPHQICEKVKFETNLDFSKKGSKKECRSSIHDELTRFCLWQRKDHLPWRLPGSQYVWHFLCNL